MSATRYRTKPGLSAIFDVSLGYGVVLDDASGTYWTLDRESLLLLQNLASVEQRYPVPDDPKTVFADKSLLESLIESGLVTQRVGSPTPCVPCLELDPITPKSDLFVFEATQELPSLSRIAEYVVLNIWFRIQLALSGWRVVRMRKSRAVLCHPVDEGLLLKTVEEILACMRIAAVVPGTSRSCIPRALTAFDICIRRGIAPRLVVGAYVEPFEPHIWVECGDQIIDNGRADFSLERFTPLEYCDFAS